MCNSNMSVACILIGGPNHRIQVSDKIILFEMHPYCGPVPLTKTERELNLGPRHPFWTAVTHWNEQGRRVSPKGICLWQPPPDFFHLYKRLDEKNYLATPESIAAENAWEKQLKKWNS